MKRTIVFSFLAVLLFASFFSFAAATGKPAANTKVLVWNGNGAYHVEVVAFTGNATGWGYDVTTADGEMNASVLTDIEILILNAQDYLNTTELTAIKTWFNGAEGRSLLVVADSDYGGYWLPNGTDTNPGVNNLLYELGSHIFIQDDAVNDAVFNDGSGYRVVAAVPNTVDSPAKAIMSGVTNVSMHGPTAVVCYETPVANGENTLGSFDNIENCQWLINSSEYGSIADQDYDDDVYWEGFPVGVNMSLTMAAIEWDVGTSNNKIACAGEAFFSDYKSMFGTEQRYANGTNQNPEFTHNLLDWFTGKIPAAPGFEFLPTIFVLALIPIAYRKRK
jgi:hypothetical protein